MRIEAEFLKLLIPLGVRIAQTFDIDAAGQALCVPKTSSELMT
jgi:hypothetical protein